jgi:hypothetical protein
MSTQEGEEATHTVDGRLTSFESIPEEVREPILTRLQRLDVYELAFTEEFAHALGMYPAAPGRWVLRPWLNRDLSVSWETARGYLSPVVVDSRDGRGRVATRAKAIVVGRQVKAGRIMFHEGLDLPFDLMHKYPFGLNEDEMQRVDSFSRATYMAVIGAGESKMDPSLSELWAQDSWRSNWRIFPCIANEDSVRSINDSGSIVEARTRFASYVESLHVKFLDVATRTDPNLYEPDRYEVLSGIVSRALPLAAALAQTPSSWSSEQGSPSIRSLVESLIVLRWLVKRDDPTQYSRFKEYGRGRLKLTCPPKTGP